MAREHLSKRAKQPGHDQRYRGAEKRFLRVMKRLTDERLCQITEKPRDLADYYRGPAGEVFGLVPELKLELKEGRGVIFYEVKRQGPKGNAEERAFRHHTVRFTEGLKRKLGVDYHAYVTVFCESLAELPRYTVKAREHIPDENLILWKGYAPEIIAQHLARVGRQWLGADVLKSA
jgi:hypothetical protein